MSIDDDIRRFIAQEQASRERIDFHTIYVDMAGDLVAGLLLSQIVYWHLPSKEGASKLRVQKDGELWLAKNISDWWDEIRLSESQVRRALQILERRNLIVRIDSMFNGKRTPFIRLNWPVFLEMRERLLEDRSSANMTTGRHEMRQSVVTKCDDRSSRNVTIGRHETRRPITETTTENTAETTSENMRPPIAGAIGGRDESPVPPQSTKPKKSNRAENIPEAVGIFRSETHRYPPKSWWEEIARTVGDTPPNLEYWRKIVHTWVGLGWNPTNVAGMLECFRRREVPTPARGGPTKPSTLDESYAAIERWREMMKSGELPNPFWEMIDDSVR